MTPLLRSSALGVALCTSIAMHARAQAATTTPTATENDIRPFRINVSDDALNDLRRRLAATRWPTKELVKDRSQGVQLATMKELARYWATEHDWRKAEAKLNALPQFVTK